MTSLFNLKVFKVLVNGDVIYFQSRTCNLCSKWCRKLHNPPHMFHSDSASIFSSTQTFSASPRSDSELFDKYEPGIKISLVRARRNSGKQLQRRWNQRATSLNSWKWAIHEAGSGLMVCHQMKNTGNICRASVTKNLAVFAGKPLVMTGRSSCICLDFGCQCSF